jgi:hypothetical protein
MRTRTGTTQICILIHIVLLINIIAPMHLTGFLYKYVTVCFAPSAKSFTTGMASVHDRQGTFMWIVYQIWPNSVFCGFNSAPML